MRSLLLGILVFAACGNGGGGGGDDDGQPDAPVPGPAKTGFVSVTSLSLVSGTTTVRSGSASASFALPNSSSCTVQAIGACNVSTCSPNPNPVLPVSAGTVTVTGASMPVTLTPKSDNTYQAVSSNTQTMFDGGETLTASGGSAEVPTFSVSVVAPSRVTLTAPAKPAASGTLLINRAQPFRATWTGGGAGNVYIYFSPSGTNVSMTCGAPASAGSIDVPASALAMLPAGMGSLSASSTSNKTTDVGDWRVYLQGFYTAIWPDMSVASTTAMIQ